MPLKTVWCREELLICDQLSVCESLTTGAVTVLSREAIRIFVWGSSEYKVAVKLAERKL